MRKFNRRGFTLLEMMLAIAIAVLISGLFITLIVTIRSTYYRVYNDVDCADLAAMYAEALENDVLYCTQNKVSATIEIDSSTGILKTTSGTFSFSEDLNKSGSQQKWDVRLIANLDEITGEFRYKFYFIDMYTNPGYLHYDYEGEFWLPSYAQYVPHTQEVDDMIEADTPNPWDYNYSNSVDRGFSISITGAGSAVTDNKITPTDTSPCFTMIRNTSIGNVEVVQDAGAPQVDVPTSSAVINIDGTASASAGTPAAPTAAPGGSTTAPTAAPTAVPGGSTTAPTTAPGGGGLGGSTPTPSPIPTPAVVGVITYDTTISGSEHSVISASYSGGSTTIVATHDRWNRITLHISDSGVMTFDGNEWMLGGMPGMNWGTSSYTLTSAQKSWLESQFGFTFN